jgi:HipA-like protein
MLDKLLKYFKKHSEGHEDLETPKDVQAKFILSYENLEIGTLEISDGIWKFYYSEDFKEQDKIRPIAQFQDKYKVYTAKELWPFFSIRIPGLSQPKVKDIIEKENIDRFNEVELLKRFGKKSISNPYDLVVA